MEKKLYIDGSTVLLVRKEKVVKGSNRRDQGKLSQAERDRLNCKELREARNKFMKKTYRSISLKYNAQKEADIIEYLDSRDNLKSYLIGLLDEEMAKHPKDSNLEKEIEKCCEAKEKLKGVQTEKKLNQFLHEKKCSGCCDFKKNDLREVLPNLSENTLANRLQKLCAQNIIEKHPQGKLTYYTIKIDPLEESQ